MLEIEKLSPASPSPPPKITKQKNNILIPAAKHDHSLSLSACLYKTQHLQNNKKPQPTNLQSCMI